MGTPPDTYNYNNEIAPEEIQSRNGAEDGTEFILLLKGQPRERGILPLSQTMFQSRDIRYRQINC
jgi:hypothetical protein